MFMYISPRGWADHDRACQDVVSHMDARYRHLISNAFLYIACPRIIYALNSSMPSCSRVAPWRITCEPSLSSNNALPLKVRAVPTWLSCGGQLGSVALVHNQWQLDHHEMPPDVPPMWIPSLGHGRNDFPSNPPSTTGLVPRDVVDD